MKTRMRTLGAAAALMVAQGALAQFDFDPGVNYATPERPDGIASADFNGNGHNDLAVAADNPDRVIFLFNNGDGAFGAPVNVLTGGGTGPGFIAVGDFDGDGDIDVAVLLKNTSTLRVLINNGSGVFTTGSNTSVGDNPRWIAVGDLDGDGDLDMAVVNRDSDSVTVLLNDGTGSFSTATIGVGQDPRSVAIGDFDRDGDPDLAVTNHDDRSISILANDGSGSFTPAGTLSVGAQVRPEGVVGVDLTGDGFADLAVATSGSGFNFATVFINTPGGMSGPFHYPVGGVDPSRIGAADFDGDGDTDLYTVNSDSGNMSVLPNDGSGAFGAATLLAAGATPRHGVAADLTGNGVPDLAVTNRDSNTTSVFVNRAAPPCLADFNGDGEVNTLDFIAFLNAWVAGDSSADINGDTVIDTRDVLAFLNLFTEGCD